MGSAPPSSSTPAHGSASPSDRPSAAGGAPPPADGTPGAAAGDTTAPAAGFAERQRVWLLLGFVAIGALLRLPMLDRAVWFDEACMSDQRIGTTAQWLSTLYVDIHPPLFVSFMHFWNGLFGDGEVSMRIPALLAGLACIPLTWWTGHRLVGHGAALFAALLLALSPVLIWYSAEARLYTPMVMCTLFAFGAFDRLLDDGAPRRGLFALHVLNVAVMLALHYYLAVVVVALAGLAPLIARGLPPRANRIVFVHGVGVVLLAGFVYVKMLAYRFETSQDYLRELTPNELFRFLFDWAWTGNTIAADGGAIATAAASAFQWLGVALALLGLAQLVRARRERPRGWLVPIGVLLLPCFLFACAAIGYGNTYLERTLIPAVPFVLLLAAAGVQALPARARLAVGGVTVAFAVTAVCCLFVYRDTHWTVYKPNSDWRSASAYLGAQIDELGGVHQVFTSTPNPRPLSYYDERIQDVKNLRPPMTAEQIGERVGRKLGATIGGLAESTFADFAAHNAALLDNAKMLVYRSRPTPDQLPICPACERDVCFVVRDQWHPHVSVDDSVEQLLAHDRVEVMEVRRFTGLSVYKICFTP